MATVYSRIAGLISGNIIDPAAFADRFGAYDSRPVFRIAYIGDSNTESALTARWCSPASRFSRSDVESDIAGDGTLTIYSNSTATWAAFGDTAGAVTDVGNGFVWLESGTAGKGVCFNITATVVATEGTALGNPITVTMAKSPDKGSTNFCPCVYGQMTSGQALFASANFGMNGDTAQGVYERIGQVFTVDSYGRPTTRKPRVVGVLIGVNDVIHLASGGGGYDVDDVKDWLTGIKNAIVAEGAIAIFGNIVLQSPTAPQIAIITELNAHIAAMAADNVRIADYHSVCNGVADAMDSAHFTNLGAQLAGEVLSPILIDIAGRAGRSDFRLGGKISPSVNRVVNGAMAGTAGDPGNMTGVVAINTGYFGVGACVGSKEAVEGENDWQVFTVTGEDGAGFIFPVFTTKALTPGSDVYAMVEIDITGAGVIAADLAFAVTNIDASITEPTHSLFPVYTKNSGESRWIAKLSANVPLWYNSSSVYMYIGPAAGDTVIKIRDLGLAQY
jgi:hypothetical protein